MADREPTPGDVLGDRYEIQAELGRGGMATVYKAFDRRLERRVALKVFRGGFAEAVDPKRTTQEMRLLAAVNHPSVVSVLDASNGDGVFGAFLVMELVVGDDLGALLHRARGPLSADFARRIVADVASALAALHELGVVHRDVKPANILVPTAAASSSAAVAAKLTDFGIAQLVDGARLTGPDSILGTAAYLSPEQVRGSAPRPASDVYSLGLVLLEALTGKRAFPGPAAEAAMARLQRPPVLPPEASPALADLLSRMTALEPAHRPPAEVVAALLREQLAGRVTAPDAAHTAPTPVAGLAPLVLAPAHPDATAPQEPLFTPSRGMPISAPIATVPARRRFPTVLAVAATVLAAATAGVAISAAVTLTDPNASVNANADARTSPTATSGPARQERSGSDSDAVGYVAPRSTARSTASPTPTPTATRTTTPSPTPAPSGSTKPREGIAPTTRPTSPAPAPASSAPAAPEPDPTTPGDGASSGPGPSDGTGTGDGTGGGTDDGNVRGLTVVADPSA